MTSTSRRTGSLGNLGITAEHGALHDVAARWLAAHCPPGLMRSSADDAAGVPEFWPEITALDWLRLAPPELAVVLEECGRVLLPGPFVPTAIARHVLDAAQVGAPPGVGAGDPLTVGLGAPVPAISAADDSLVLDGAARPILCGAVARAVVVGADLPDGAHAWCVVATDAPGVSVVPLPSVDPTRPLAEIGFDGVRVPTAQVIRHLDRDAVIDIAVAALAAECTGGAQWCVDTAAEHARTRTQFGRPIGMFQAVKHACADMALAVEQARAVAWDAAQALADSPDGKELAIAAAAVVAPQAFVDCAKSAIQVLGGIGFTWEHDAHRYLRRSAAVRALLDESRWPQHAARLAVSGVRRTRDAALPAEAQTYREEVRRFIESVDTVDETAARGALVSSGYLVPEWPRPWGRSASAVEQVVVDEEFRSAGVRRPDLLVGMWVLPTLIAHGTAEQQERWIRPTLLGEITWCQLFSEPDAGSDLASLTTKAARVDNGWRLTGQKVWTSLAHVADWGIALARTATTDPPHAGITCFIVDMRSPGVDVRPLRELTGFASFNEVFLADVLVPDDAVIGEVGDGWSVGRTTLANERVSMGRGSTLGKGIEGLVRLVADDARLHDDVSVLDRLGHLVAEGHALGVLGSRLTLRALSGGSPGPEASVRKLLAAEHDQRVEELGLRLLGPEGATQDGRARVWSNAFLMTRCLTIAGGTSEIQRNVLAERLLLLPRDA